MVMMDIKEKESSSEELGEKKKCCADCKTTKTPLWRGGPAGPKTLCNACGIKYRKKRASPAAGLVKGQDRKRERSESRDGGTSSTRLCGGSELKESFRMKLMAVGEEVLLQRSSSVGNGKKKQRRNNLGEEEKQAAICLMALSCGYVFA